MAHHKKSWKFKEGKFTSDCLYFSFYCRNYEHPILKVDYISSAIWKPFVTLILTFGVTVNKWADSCYFGQVDFLSTFFCKNQTHVKVENSLNALSLQNVFKLQGVLFL